MSKKATATICNAGHILTLAGQKGLTEDAFDDLNRGFLADLFEAAVRGKLKDKDREEFRKTIGLPPLTPPVLELVREIEAPATEAFELLDFFNKDNKDVKFAHIDGDIVKYFPDGHIPAEGPRHLAIHRLTRSATEKEFRATDIEKTTWADLKWMLEQQPKGEKGDLRTNGQANLFFIGSCLVRVRWYDVGWSVDVDSGDGSYAWLGGRRRFSRN